MKIGTGIAYALIFVGILVMFAGEISGIAGLPIIASGLGLSVLGCFIGHLTDKL